MLSAEVVFTKYIPRTWFNGSRERQMEQLLFKAMERLILSQSLLFVPIVFRNSQTSRRSLKSSLVIRTFRPKSAESQLVFFKLFHLSHMNFGLTIR